MGVTKLSLAQLLSADTWQEVVTTFLNTATSLGLNTTAWQALGITRTTITTVAQKVSDVLGMIATAVSGGFLTLAPDGAVDASGNVQPGWVDLVAYNQFNQQRQFAQSAVCTQQVTNTGTATYDQAVGQFHCVNPVSGATYTNTTPLVVAPGGIGTCTVQADVPGTLGTSGVGVISQLAQPAAGIATTNLTAAIGLGATPKATLVSSCTSKWSTLSGKGAPGAYVFFAQNPQDVNGNAYALKHASPVTQAIASLTSNGAVTVTVSATGPVSGASSVPIQSITSSSGLIEVQASGHGLLSGDFVQIANVVGTVPVNGSWASVTVIDSSHFTLDGSVFSGSYTSGGIVTGGDLGYIAISVIANATPIGSTPTIQSAGSASINPIGTVYVRNATQTSAQILNLISTALSSMFALVPIGGYNIPGGGSNVLPLQLITSTIAAAVPGVIVDVVLTSPSADVNLVPAGHLSVPILASVTSLSIVAV